MRMCFPLALALALTGLAAPASARDLTRSTPNTPDPLTTPVGTLDFVLVHRFYLPIMELDELEASPTFVLSTGLSDHVELGVDAVTASAVGNGVLAEPMLKYQALAAESPFQLTAMLAYNTGAVSGDAALMGAWDVGPLSLRAIAKGFTSAYGVGGHALAAGAGAVWHVNGNWGICADYNQVLWAQDATAIDAQRPLVPAWSLGADFKIPYSPHSLSLYATNGNTFTLEGTSRGGATVRYGFSFDIPFDSLDRYKAIFRPPQD